MSGVKVFAPATVANVAVGYDILGFCLDRPGDEIIVKKGQNPGLHISRITGCKNKLPFDIQKNTASFGAFKLLESLGFENEPIEMEIHKKMPFGSGLGSSAASSAAGVLAVNEYLKKPYTKKELVPFAVLGESAADGAMHGDNVIPSLLGGIILIRDNGLFDFIQIPIPKGLYAFVIYPHMEIKTKDAREILSDHISLKNHIKQSGNLASLIAGFYTNNLELIQKSLVDVIIEPQRCKLIPHFQELKEVALKHGAMNYTISGAGPSMFGFCENTIKGERILEALSKFCLDKGIQNTTYLSKINPTGSFKY